MQFISGGCSRKSLNQIVYNIIIVVKIFQNVLYLIMGYYVVMDSPSPTFLTNGFAMKHSVEE